MVFFLKTDLGAFPLAYSNKLLLEHLFKVFSGEI